MSRRRYFEEQRSGNGAIYHCVKTEIEPGDRIRLFNLMNKVPLPVMNQCQYGLHLTRILQVNNRVLYTSFR